MEKMLEVKNLSTVFNTDNGTVQAVRDVSFDVGRHHDMTCIIC